MPTASPLHPADVPVAIAALQDQIDDLTDIVRIQQRQIDALSKAIASQPDAGES